MKKNNTFTFSTLLLGLLSLPLMASNDLPDVQDTIEPPPAASIDSFLPLVLFIIMVTVGYYFRRSEKSLLNKKNRQL